VRVAAAAHLSDSIAILAATKIHQTASLPKRVTKEIMPVLFSVLEGVRLDGALTE
jgi:hypothetical protein